MVTNHGSFNMPEATGNGNIWEAEPVDNVPRVNFDFRHYTRSKTNTCYP